MTRERVVSCLSGGVDSSVAAALLVEAGYDVVGVFMRSGVSGHATGESQGCCSVEDALDARRVADQLGIPFYALNMEEAFGRLIERFVDDYARGRTPNPCVLCNRWLKVGHVLEYARRVGANWVATGHYARRQERGDRVTLARPEDSAKDQSYVLAVLEQEQLRRLLLPLGEFSKTRVRELARERGLDRVAGKRDSQEICFVSSDYRELLRERLPADAPALQAGEIQDAAGAVLGQHDGTADYTVGQRRGLKIAHAHPLYVQRTDPGRRLVVVGPAESLGFESLVAVDATWLGAALERGQTLRGRAQVRAHGRTYPALLTCTGPRAFDVRFDAPVRAVVAGQAVVLYDEHDRQVLCSGWIESAQPAQAALAQDATS